LSYFPSFYWKNRGRKISWIQISNS